MWPGTCNTVLCRRTQHQLLQSSSQGSAARSWNPRGKRTLGSHGRSATCTSPVVLERCPCEKKGPGQRGWSLFPSLSSGVKKEVSYSLRKGLASVQTDKTLQRFLKDCTTSKDVWDRLAETLKWPWIKQLLGIIISRAKIMQPTRVFYSFRKQSFLSN